MSKEQINITFSCDSRGFHKSLKKLNWSLLKHKIRIKIVKIIKRSATMFNKFTDFILDKLVDNNHRDIICCIAVVGAIVYFGGQVVRGLLA